jgi:hypothetical protein
MGAPLKCPEKRTKGYYTFLSNRVRGGYLRAFSDYIEQIPVPKRTKEQEAAITSLVDRILSAKQQDPAADVSALEAEIDAHVYRLYGLTDDEIRRIEDATRRGIPPRGSVPAHEAGGAADGEEDADGDGEEGEEEGGAEEGGAEEGGAEEGGAEDEDAPPEPTARGRKGGDAGSAASPPAAAAPNAAALPDAYLRTALLDIVHWLETNGHDLPLILGGGYGLRLKRERAEAQVEARGVRLYFPDSVPPVRSTEDLDLFLKIEILAESPRLKPLRDSLDALGFRVIPGSENWQFVRKVRPDDPDDRGVRIDLLARRPDDHPGLSFDRFRVKPKPSVGLHARTTPEAVAIENLWIPHTLQGTLSTGEEYTGNIYLPQTYAFLLMKLFALRDQVNDPHPKRLFGQKHALDLYTLAALLTEEESEAADELSRMHRDSELAQEAAQIVADLFGSAQSLGVLRLKEHPFCPSTVKIDEFCELLRDLFPLMS